MKNSTRPALARGFTALELIIVLVIGFSIIAMSASKMGELFNSSKATQMASALLDLSTAISELKGPNGYDANANLIKQLVDADALPKSIIQQGTADEPTLMGIWKSAITLTYAAATDSVTITYGQVPKSACNKALKNLLANRTFKSIQGTGAALIPGSTTTQQIIDACTPAAGNNGVDLMFQQ